MDEIFPVIEVHADWVIAAEPMGSKEKQWVLRPGDALPWLFKCSRESMGVPTGEHWAEKIAAEVAARLEVPHAVVELATFDGQPGCLSQKFPALADEHVELVHGNVLLAGFVTGYDRTKLRKQSEHNVHNILGAVEALFPDPSEREAALRQLAGYLLLDALILNTDRHHENWAVLRISRPGARLRHEVAPSFDHASSLARNEPPDKLAMWLKEVHRPGWYAERAKGGIYLHDGDPKGANPLTLAVFAARRWPVYFEGWKCRIAALNQDALDAIVERVPSQMMRKESKWFAQALLAVTLNRLKRL